MKICVLGADGYLGWPTSMYFSQRGHTVMAVDNGAKRKIEAEIDSYPLRSIPSLSARVGRWNELSKNAIELVEGDISTDPTLVHDIFSRFKPDAIIHYAEQPSAPYSMIDLQRASYTQQNNVIGTLNVMFAMQEHCPQAHMIKLGTMGEYGTPNIDIEEGWLDVTHNGRQDRVLFPKRPPSFYHLSKVHDSANLEFGCRIWNLRVTDLNQGVVYGFETNETRLDDGLHTSFHYDDVFGTVLNRFVVQAVIGTPLTVYGRGGQTRGYLNILDTLACVELSALHPAAPGEFRVFNQFTEQFSIVDIANHVKRAAAKRGIDVAFQNTPNPRVELEEHYYKPTHTALLDLGLKPHLLSDEVIDGMLAYAEANKTEVREALILPRVDFRRGMAEREPATAAV